MTMQAAHATIAKEEYVSLDYSAHAGTSLMGLFLKFKEIKDFARALPGVPDATMDKMFLLPRRTIVDGKHMVAILYYDSFWNILAWCVNAPDNPYIWLDDPQAVLGRDEMEAAVRAGRLPTVFETPLAWLQHDMKGVVYLG